MTARRDWSPWLGALLPLAILAFWQLRGEFGALPRYLPAPSIILAQWVEMLVSGELVGHAAISLYRALAGFVVAASLGVLVGLLAAAFRPVETFYDPIISLTYPVPKIAALPIIFAWFGLGNLSKIIIISVSVFYPVYIATLAGAKATGRVHIWAARNMGASRLAILTKVLFPAALPQIFNGLRVGLALSFIVMFVAEMVSSNEGLGYLIVFADNNQRFELVFVAILTIGLLGFAADRLLLTIRRRVLVGQLASTEARR